MLQQNNPRQTNLYTTNYANLGSAKNPKSWLGQGGHRSGAMRWAIWFACTHPQGKHIGTHKQCVGLARILFLLVFEEKYKKSAAFKTINSLELGMPLVENFKTF